jgi:hypothetical protein
VEPQIIRTLPAVQRIPPSPCSSSARILNHAYSGVADHDGTIRAYLQAVQQFAVQFGIIPVKLSDGYKVQLT